MARVVVIGGGVSGLSAAYRLLTQAPELDVPLLEASDRTGGILRSELTSDGYLIERGPDAFITDKPWALALAKELGLSDEIISTRNVGRGSYVVRDGKLRRIPDGYSLLAPTRFWPFMMSDVVSWRGKARAALDLVLPRGVPRDDESLAHFARRRFGRELFERLAQPLASGIYGADPYRLSLRATMPRFLDAERDSRSVILGLRKKAQSGDGASGVRYGLFASFRGGMQTLTDALTAKLGARVSLSSRVRELALRSEGGYRVVLESGEAILADAVIVALPGPAAAPLLDGVAPEIASGIAQVQHGSAATATLAYRVMDIPHPLDAFGFVVPSIEKRVSLASTWASVKFEGRAPDGRALLRVFLGGQHAADAHRSSDDELIATARKELRELLLISAEPLLSRVDRYVNAMPQYFVGHLDLVDRIEHAEAQHAGLALACTSLRGVGIPDSVHAGERAASRVLAYLASTRS